MAIDVPSTDGPAAPEAVDGTRAARFEPEVPLPPAGASELDEAVDDADTFPVLVNDYRPNGTGSDRELREYGTVGGLAPAALRSLSRAGTVDDVVAWVSERSGQPAERVPLPLNGILERLRGDDDNKPFVPPGSVFIARQALPGQEGTSAGYRARAVGSATDGNYTDLVSLVELFPGTPPVVERLTGYRPLMTGHFGDLVTSDAETIRKLTATDG